MSKIIIPYVKTEGYQCAYNQKTSAELRTIDDLIDDANEELIDSVKEIKKLQSEIEVLQKENEILKEALEFYADIENWHQPNQSFYRDKIKINFKDTETMGAVEVGGKQARQALKQLTEDEE